MKEHFGDDWRNKKDVLWYKNLLKSNGGENLNISKNNETQEAQNEICDYLDEENAVHI